MESTETKIQKLVAIEMQTINWDDIDSYPLFDNCDELAPKAEQRLCFENTLLTHFSATINEFEFPLETEITDSLYLDFLINAEGKIVILDLEENRELIEQFPEFEGIIVRSLRNMPSLRPAIKRGTPITAKFRIPIIINTN